MAGDPATPYDEMQAKDAADASGIPYVPPDDVGGGGEPTQSGGEMSSGEVQPVSSGPPTPDETFQDTQNSTRKGDDSTNQQVFPSPDIPIPEHNPKPAPPSDNTPPDTTPPTPLPPPLNLPPDFTPDNPNNPLPGHPAEPTPPSDGRTIDDLFPPPGPSQISPQERDDFLNSAPGQISPAEKKAQDEAARKHLEDLLQ